MKELEKKTFTRVLDLFITRENACRKEYDEDGIEDELEDGINIMIINTKVDSPRIFWLLTC